MSEWSFAGATALARAVREGEVGASELLRHYLDRTQRFNPGINAIVVLDAERAMRRAEAADRARAAGEIWGPLHGVPMTVKESFDIEGLPTTRGMPELETHVATGNALAVERLLAAGATIFGKTNVPYGLADFQSYNEIYGTTRNPWDRSRTPGGSSGGAAAALAAGLTGLEVGSDIGGSIRNPAHYCGVYGHKSTWGILPMRGHAMPGSLAPSDISVIGPLARSAEDLALALAIMAGPDRIEARGLRVELPEPSQRSLGEFRVAVWADDPFCPVEPEVRAAVLRAARAAEGAGATVEETRPGFDPGEVHDLYTRLLRAALGARSPDRVFEKMLRRAEQLEPDDHSELAVRLRASVMRHREWSRLHELRTRLRWQWHAFFEDWDVLLCPVACGPAFAHDHSPDMESRTLRIAGVVRSYWDQLFWAGLAGVAWLPATVAPAGRSTTGLPIGVQVMGPEYGDRISIEFTRLLAAETGGFQPPPGYA